MGSIIVRCIILNQTLECDRMDVSGLCLGHKISRKEFLERYCGGIKPEAKRTKASYGI
jgi:hypothetical protein